MSFIRSEGDFLDLVTFADEDSAPPPPEHRGFWRILIVDDDTSVHRSIDYALRDVLILGRSLEILNAHSSEEAFSILARESNIAVVLLDVVMEHENSGLELVKKIRVDLGLSEIRIVLHTGQPGLVPEISAIRDYDINDYRAKSELTRKHLYTCLASAVRAYQQICTINTSRRQLHHIVQASNALIGEPDEQAFARGLLQQFAHLFELEAEGFVLGGLSAGAALATVTETTVICALGSFAPLRDRGLAQLFPQSVRDCCARSQEAKEAQWCDEGVALKVAARNGHYMVAFLRANASEREGIDESIIEAFEGYCSACMDNRALLERLQYDAYHDRLLDLPNRHGLKGYLDKRYATGSYSQDVLALIDIDRFGELNDALGHAFGDALLQAVAERLRRGLPLEVVLARISADVFAVLGPGSIVSPEILHRLFAMPLAVQDEETMISVTMGLTRLPDIESSNSDASLAATFQALRSAKQSQPGQSVWYSPELSQRTLERVTLLNGLRHSLRNSGLFVVYQPQILLKERKLIGMEALVRWRTESGALIGPDRFIPVAEQSGLIREIGAFVLREALTVLARLNEEGFSGLRMAVNVSAVQFRHPDFLEELQNCIKASGVDPRNLELEITESIAMEDAVYVRRTLEAIRAQGVQLAIDDFGTGFSSLAQLKRLAVDRLKIDRAFIQDLNEAELEASISGVVVQLGQRLGIQVIAEGVETETQAMLLERLGCKEAQGFLFARPLEIDALRLWMRDKQVQISQ